MMNINEKINAPRESDMAGAPSIFFSNLDTDDLFEIKENFDLDLFPIKFFMLLRSFLSFPMEDCSSVELHVLFLCFRNLLVSLMSSLDTWQSMASLVLCSRLRKTLEL